jgi:ABC-type multidrug transport system fused ATPase/permease subunit
MGVWQFVNLERLMAGRTTFVTSHRFSLVRGADVILVFDKGEIAERGSHPELLAQGGLYAGMYEMQTGNG